MKVFDIETEELLLRKQTEKILTAYFSERALPAMSIDKILFEELKVSDYLLAIA